MKSSIRTRFSALLIAMLAGLLLVCNSIVFAQVRVYFQQELQTRQHIIAQGNKGSLESFLAMVDQSGIAVVADRLIGSQISLDSDDLLEMLSARTSINGQFYHLTSTITGAEGYYFRSMLFVDHRLPLAAYFGEATLDISRGAMNCVYSNAQVYQQDWYQTAMAKNRALYIFLSEDEQSLCLARKVQNPHYVGPYQADGLGVMVTRVELSRLEQIFSFSQISENTVFYLVSPEGMVLYASDPQQIGKPYAPPEQESARTLSYEDELNWDLRLIFHTPASDMDRSILPLMRIFVLTSLAIASIAIAVAMAASHAVTRPIINLSQIMGRIRDTRQADLAQLDIRPRRDDEVTRLYDSFASLLQRVNGLIDDVERRTQMQKTAELKMMQAQINPHFLYNAMDSINWIALRNGQDDIVDMISHLASLLRYSIADSGSSVTLAQEVDNIGHYFALQKVRYGDRVSLQTDVQAEALTAVLPRVTLQPLLENTFHHGLGVDDGEILIRLSAKREADVVIITLCDNGLGCDAERLNRYLAGEDGVLQTRGGLGIRNVNERLRMSGGSLCYRNTPDGGLQAQILLPTASPESPATP